MFFKRVIVFLFILTATSLAQGVSESDSLKAEQMALDTLVDYNETYLNLIEQEKKYISHKTNLAILGGILIGGGGAFTAMYAKDGFDSDGQETLKETLRMELFIASIGITAIGVLLILSA